MKTIGHFLSFLFAWTLYLPFRILPYRACQAFGVGFLRLLYPIARGHRAIALENIAHAFPAMSHAQHQELVRKHFRHLGLILADSLYIPRMDRKWLEENVVYEKGARENEQDALARGVPTIILTGHLGAWEVLGAICGQVYHGGTLYKKMRNPFLDRWFGRIRGASGLRLFPIEETTAAIKELKRGMWMGFVADQNAGRAGVFVDFLNRPASTYQGPVAMSCVTGARICVYACVHGPDRKIHLSLTDLGVIDPRSGRREELIRKYTQLWSDILAEKVREYPEQYFWVHRRWKTRPEDVVQIAA